jgi:hypothetical protein
VAYGKTSGRNCRLDLRDSQGAEVEDRRCQDRIGACGDRRREVCGLTCSTGGNQRHIDHGAYGPDHLQVET